MCLSLTRYTYPSCLRDTKPDTRANHRAAHQLSAAQWAAHKLATITRRRGFSADLRPPGQLGGQNDKHYRIHARQNWRYNHGDPKQGHLPVLHKGTSSCFERIEHESNTRCHNQTPKVLQKNLNGTSQSTSVLPVLLQARWSSQSTAQMYRCSCRNDYRNTYKDSNYTLYLNSETIILSEPQKGQSVLRINQLSMTEI